MWQRIWKLRCADCWLSLIICMQMFEILWAQAQKQQNAAGVGAAATPSASTYPPTYFFMDQNGSYKYAFDTGNEGIVSEQSANQANEVTGQYSYFENGVPYMVKYKAGVQGYQAEIMQRENLNKLFGERKQSVKLSEEKEQKQSSNFENEFVDGSVGAAKVGLGGGEAKISSTLQFVQDAMEMMRSRPLQLSFTSQQGFAGPAQNVGPPAPVMNQEIRLKSAPEVRRQQQQQQQREPYEFAYLSEQSSRSESADKSGNIIGKYSYQDEAGLHELKYMAGDEIGFVVLGGNLAMPQAQAQAQPKQDDAFLIVNVSQQPHFNYNYRVRSNVNERNARMRRNSRSAAFNNLNTKSNNNNNNRKDFFNGRSKRKFQRQAHW